jgi:hypothetical protein
MAEERLANKARKAKKTANQQMLPIAASAAQADLRRWGNKEMMQLASRP